MLSSIVKSFPPRILVRTTYSSNIVWWTAEFHKIQSVFLNTAESEPSDRETELWQELTATRAALARADRELLQARQDKEGFLESLARIAVMCTVV